MKKDSDFNLFYQRVSKNAERTDDLNKSVSPRKQRRSNPAVRKWP